MAEHDDLLVALQEACERAISAFASGSDKIMRLNPTWGELPRVLTADELAVMYALLFRGKFLR